MSVVDRKFGTGERQPLAPEPSWEQVVSRNAIERLKEEKAPARIVDELPQLAERHYLDIPEEDIVRLRWYGLYHDKPKVGEYMLRVKIPSGLLTAEGVRIIAGVAERFGKGYTELTTRQNVQLHFLQLRDVPEILRDLSAVGITTAGACGDAVRNVTGCPLGGILAVEAFDVTPFLREAAAFFATTPEYLNLPRKHKITIAACPSQCDMPEINCIALIGTHLDGVPGFAVRVGGGLSTAPRIARDLGVFTPVDGALDVLRALLDEWSADRRYRLSRVKARMKFMVDDYGPEEVRAKVEARLGHALTDLPAPEPDGFADHMGVHEQKQPGLFHIGVPVPLGIVQAEQLRAIADLAADAGADVRLTKQQNAILANVPHAHVDHVVAALGEIGFPFDANPLHATAIACTGEPHCNFAVTETKGRLQGIVTHLEERWGDRLGGFRVNLDGCPHACALHWVGDVGLMGTTARVAVEGDKRAFDLFLRGGSGPLAAIGRPLVRRVPFPQVEDTLDRLIQAWLDGRTGDDEPFRDFCIRTPDDELLAIAAGGVR
jgi:sulfite reductase beta subunit-like hemoprotein